MMQTLNLSGFCGSKCDILSYCSGLRCGGRIGVPTSPSGTQSWVSGLCRRLVEKGFFFWSLFSKEHK